MIRQIRMDGTWVEYGCIICGIWMEYGCNMNYMGGVWVKYRWSMGGTCIECGLLVFGGGIWVRFSN